MFFTLGLNKLPFEPQKEQIIYVENEYSKPVNNYIQKNYEAIRSHFKKNGLEFIYMPKLMEKVKSPEFIMYNAPYAEGIKEDVNFTSDFLLQFMAHPENKKTFPPSLVYYCPQMTSKNYPEAMILYRGIALDSESNYRKAKNLSNVLTEIIGDTGGIWNWLDMDVRRYDEDLDDEGFYKIPMACEEPASYGSDEDDEPYESEILMKLGDARSLIDELKALGVSEYVLLKLIYGEEKPSRLHITKDYRIFLPDFSNMEIELGPLPKILFLLYLKHPEGIYFKDLSDYREELLQYYKAVRGGLFSLTDAKSKIARLTDSTDNSRNEKCTAIKNAFVNKIKERLAKNYYIVGERAEKRRITLPREMVIWDD